jgi:two-component system, NarL family, nitrate/nitrite response regulator NarL
MHPAVQPSFAGSDAGSSVPDRATPELIRVLVVDRNHLSSQLLADSLTRDPRFQVLVAMPSEAVVIAAKRHPHLAILSADFDSGKGEGNKLARRLSDQFSGMGILILLDRIQRGAIVQAFRGGAKGVFCRTESMEEFLRGVDHISRGEMWAGRAESDCLLEAFRSVSPDRIVATHGLEGLTPRELQVVQHAAHGLTNKAIGKQLHLSEHTVKNYLFRAFDKVGVSSRIELLFYLMVKGRKLSAGETGIPNSEDSVEKFQQAARDGFTGAQFFLGLAYREGYNVERSLKDAYFWFKMAEQSAGEVLAQTKCFASELKSELDAEEVERIHLRVRTTIPTLPTLAQRGPEAFVGPNASRLEKKKISA